MAKNHFKLISCNFFVFLFLFLSQVYSINNNNNNNIEKECPICIRVIKSSQDFKEASSSKSFEKYCSLTTISVEEHQFCYNTEGIKKELFRLLDLGVDVNRVCKKIQKINPDFCSIKVFNIHQKIEDKKNEINYYLKGKRGIIYE